MNSCSIESSFFKHQVLVRFNHIIYIRQGINSTITVVPFLYAVFELLARFTNIHNHTPEVYEKGQFQAKPPLLMLEGGIGRFAKLDGKTFPQLNLYN
jgi:hypothetical protein